MVMIRYRISGFASIGRYQVYLGDTRKKTGLRDKS